MVNHIFEFLRLISRFNSYSIIVVIVGLIVITRILKKSCLCKYAEEEVIN